MTNRSTISTLRLLGYSTSKWHLILILALYPLAYLSALLPWILVHSTGENVGESAHRPLDFMTPIGIAVLTTAGIAVLGWSRQATRAALSRLPLRAVPTQAVDAAFDVCMSIGLAIPLLLAFAIDAPPAHAGLLLGVHAWATLLGMVLGRTVFLSQAGLIATAVPGALVFVVLFLARSGHLFARSDGYTALAWLMIIAVPVTLAIWIRRVKGELGFAHGMFRSATVTGAREWTQLGPWPRLPVRAGIVGLLTQGNVVIPTVSLYVAISIAMSLDNQSHTLGLVVIPAAALVLALAMGSMLQGAAGEFLRVRPVRRWTLILGLGLTGLAISLAHPGMELVRALRGDGVVTDMVRAEFTVPAERTPGTHVKIEFGGKRESIPATLPPFDQRGSRIVVMRQDGVRMWATGAAVAAMWFLAFFGSRWRRWWPGRPVLSWVTAGLTTGLIGWITVSSGAFPLARSPWPAPTLPVYGLVLLALLLMAWCRFARADAV